MQEECLKVDVCLWSYQWNLQYAKEIAMKVASDTGMQNAAIMTYWKVSYVYFLIFFNF